MTQYIDKNVVVAEIEGKIKKYTLRGEESDFLQDGNAKYWGGVLSCLNEIHSYLNTLEVKEADLEKKINREPSLPSNLDEAAENYYEQDCPYDGEARVVNREHDVWFPSQAIEDAFKAGAEWMSKRLTKNDIEYIRTDVFLEKATEWLRKNADNYTWYDETEGESGLTDDFIDDFKKYMKGE